MLLAVNIINIIIFLCWGSFLNAFAYRIINGHSLLTRSFCPNCQTTIAWYDLIPVLSWFILKFKCRNCKTKISLLYPFIEILTAIILSLASYLINPQYFIACFIFFSALIVTIRTDLEYLLISRLMTIYLVPFAWLLASLNLLNISLAGSILGSIIGYFSLWFISKIYFILRKKEGIGEGDFDLLALIGAFCGILGVWHSILIGSILGSIIGIAIAIFKSKDINTLKIPFGPWLALGAISYKLFIETGLVKVL